MQAVKDAVKLAGKNMGFSELHTFELKQHDGIWRKVNGTFFLFKDGFRIAVIADTNKEVNTVLEIVRRGNLTVSEPGKPTVNVFPASGQANYSRISATVGHTATRLWFKVIFDVDISIMVSASARLGAAAFHSYIIDKMIDICGKDAVTVVNGVHRLGWDISEPMVNERTGRLCFLVHLNDLTWNKNL